VNIEKPMRRVAQFHTVVASPFSATKSARLPRFEKAHSELINLFQNSLRAHMQEPG
jgi:hypothetical protein